MSKAINVIVCGVFMLYTWKNKKKGWNKWKESICRTNKKKTKKSPLTLPVLLLHNVDLDRDPLSHNSYFACTNAKVALQAAQHLANHCVTNGDHYNHPYDVLPYYFHYYLCHHYANKLPYLDYIAYYCDVVVVEIVQYCYPTHFVIPAADGKTICIPQPEHTNLLSMKYCIWK